MNKKIEYIINNKKLLISKKKRKTKITNKCKCGKTIDNRNKSGFCITCYNLNQRKVNRPIYEQLLIDIEKLNWTNTGKKYNVSDNTIRKWIKQYKKKVV